MGDLAFGMLRHPAKAFRGLLLSGLVLMDRDGVTCPVAIPFDYLRWGAGGGRMQRSVGGASRYLACPIFSGFDDLSTEERQALTFPYVKLTLDGTAVSLVEVAMGRVGGSLEIEDWATNWVVFAET